MRSFRLIWKMKLKANFEIYFRSIEKLKSIDLLIECNNYSKLIIRSFAVEKKTCVFPIKLIHVAKKLLKKDSSGAQTQIFVLVKLQ